MTNTKENIVKMSSMDVANIKNKYDKRTKNIIVVGNIKKHKTNMETSKYNILKMGSIK